MCRLSAYFGAPICAADLVTKPNRSIVRQSFDARERMSGDAATPGYLNGDGFGLGWYAVDRCADPIPCTYRQARPAWHDTNLRNISAKVITPVLFAHVRATTSGQCVSEATCHPFRAGRYLWMHNGGVGGYGTIRRTLLAGLDDQCFDYAMSNGPSDSSLCFAIFLNQLRKTMGRRQGGQLPVAKASAGGGQASAGTAAVGAGRVLAEAVGAPDGRADADGEAVDCRACTETNTTEYCGFDGDLPVCTPDQLREHLEETILIIKATTDAAGITEMSLLNFVVSDGNALIATRFVINSADPDAPAASLYWSSGNGYSCEGDGPRSAGQLVESEPLDGVLPPPEGSYSMQHTDRRATLAMVSSEPLTDDRTDWVAVPRNHVLVITPCIHVLVSPIGVRGSAISPALARLTAYNQEATVVPGITASDSSPPSSPSLRPHPALRSVLRSPPAALNSPGNCRFRLRGHAKPVLSMAVLEPYLFSGAQDGSVRVWDLHSRCLVAIMASHRGGVLALAADARRRLIYSAAADSSVCIWRVTEDRGDAEGRPPAPGSRTDAAADNPLVVKPVTLPALGHVLSGQAAVNGGGGDSSASMAGDETLQGPGFRCVRRVTCDSWGDIFSLAILNDRLHAGFRDTRVRWTDVSDAVLEGASSTTASAATPVGCAGVGSGDDSGSESSQSPHTVLGAAVFTRPRLSEPAAQHCSYVFALVGHGTMLMSGCGDGLIRVFDAASGRLLRVLHGHRSGVLALAMTGVQSEPADVVGSFPQADGARRRKGALCGGRRPAYGNLLFSGSRDKTVKVWDADSGFACKRTLAHGDDVLSVQLGPGVLLTGQADGVVRVWSLRSLTCTRAFNCGSLETLAVSVQHGALFTASRDGDILAWDLADPPKLSMLGRARGDKPVAVATVDVPAVREDDTASRFTRGLEDGAGGEGGDEEDDEADELDPKVAEERELEDALAEFVSLQSVSGSSKAEHREDCWQAAKWFASLLEDWGAAVQLATTAESSVNPLIIARFTSPHTNAPTVAFYGHYDVMPADGAAWKTPPFSLTSINGYLYGRGSTDDKGPLLAFAFAVKELTKLPGGLPINVVFAIEGHGESSNFGFREMVEAHQPSFEGVDLILISNSYWSGDNRPCLTYGMRGSLDVEVNVSGPPRNLHSGVDGGAIVEPLNDLITVLSTLVDSRGVGLVPGFFDGVRAVSEEDRRLLADVEHMNGYRTRTGCTSFTSNNEEELLSKRWLLPSLSVTSITTSNVAAVSSIIPRAAVGTLSVRFVPDQHPAEVLAAITSHLRHEFGKRRSPNQLDVACTASGDWWLGTPTGAEYALAERAVCKVWGEPPLYVREGGTMPIVSFLSRTLGAPVVQVPLGQASDGAHLPNERIRALNLHNGKLVFQLMLTELAAVASVEGRANGGVPRRGLSRSSTQSLSSPLHSCANSPTTSAAAELMAASVSAVAADAAASGSSFADLSASLSKRLALKKMAFFDGPVGTHHR